MSSSRSSEPPVAWADEGTTFLVLMHHPPANQLGTGLVSGLSAAVAAFERSAARTLLITSQLPGLFGAGGDIKLMASADASTFAGVPHLSSGPCLTGSRPSTGRRSR